MLTYVQVWLGQRQLCRWVADRECAYEASPGYFDTLGHVLPSNKNAYR